MNSPSQRADGIPRIADFFASPLPGLCEDFEDSEPRLSAAP